MNQYALILTIFFTGFGLFLISYYKMHAFMKEHGKNIQWSAFYLPSLVTEYYALTLKKDGKCGVWLKLFLGSIIIPFVTIPTIMLIT